MRKLMFFVFLMCVPALAQTGHEVILTWTASIDPGVTYNIYRAPTACSGSGTFSQVSTGITALTYTDSSISAGSYCYYATASLNGVESVPSNKADALVKPGTVTITVTLSQ